MTFRTAFFISFSVHFLALFSGVALPFHKNENKLLPEDIEVTYILTERPHEKNFEIIKFIPQRQNLESETKIANQKPAEEFMTQKPAPSRVERDKEFQEVSRYLKAEEAREIENYIAYYDILRERIRNEVLKYYESINGVGEIDVIFILNPDGALTKLHIDDIKSAPDGALRKLAEKGVKEAAPFPPFPKTLRKSALTFCIPIIFTKE